MILSKSLEADVLVPQTELYTQGTAILTVSVTLPSPAEGLISCVFRWFAKAPETTMGDRVAQLRINQVWSGPLLVDDTMPKGPWQTSSGLALPWNFSAGSTDIELVAGGCCGFYGHDFYVGAGSRVDVWIP